MQQETALAAPEVDAHSAIAPRPTTIEETGLSENYLADLIAKHLLQGGALTIAELSQRLALAGSVVEEMVMFMRQEARLEVLGASIDIAALRFSLTDRGRNFALDALMRSSYSGPAAVPLEKYVEVVRAQSIHGRTVTREMIENLFAGMVFPIWTAVSATPLIFFISGTASTSVSSGWVFSWHSYLLSAKKLMPWPPAEQLNFNVISVFHIWLLFVVYAFFG